MNQAISKQQNNHYSALFKPKKYTAAIFTLLIASLQSKFKQFTNNLI